MRFPKTLLGSPLAPKASVPQRHVCSNTKVTGPPAPPARHTHTAGLARPPPLTPRGECQGNSGPALLGQHIAPSLQTLGPPGIKRKSLFHPGPALTHQGCRHASQHRVCSQKSAGCFYCLASCGKAGSWNSSRPRCQEDLLDPLPSPVSPFY